jgi:hypothetical protein
VNTEKPEVFRGHVEECLKHFSESLISRVTVDFRGTAQIKKQMADFCGVSIDTVRRRWIHDARLLPVGEEHIKLMCFLDLMGYRIIELERIPAGRRHFTELVGYGIISAEQAVNLLGYSRKGALYRVLQHQNRTSEQKEQIMWNIWKEKKEELEKKKEQLGKIFHSSEPHKVELRVEEIKSKKTIPASKSAMISIMEGLLVMLKEESPESLSGEDFVDFQKSADTILRLSARLSSLSSRIIMSKERKGDGE